MAQPKVVLEKPGIEPETPDLQGIWLIHYTTAASTMEASISTADSILSVQPFLYLYCLMAFSKTKADL